MASHHRSRPGRDLSLTGRPSVVERRRLERESRKIELSFDCPIRDNGFGTRQCRRSRGLAAPNANALPSRPRRHAVPAHGGTHAHPASAPQRTTLGHSGRPARRPPKRHSGAATGGARAGRFSGFQISRFPRTSRCAGLSAAGWGRGGLAIWKPGSLPGAPRAPSKRKITGD
jgi:hypothetical protein